MQLTAKQEAFAQAIASGLNQSDAYRSAYSAGAMKAETIQKRASELMANGGVAGRVASLRSQLQDKALWTRERSVQVLAGIADSSECKAGEVVSAVKELNAMHGFNAPAKVELSGAVMTRIELVPMRGNSTD